MSINCMIYRGVDKKLKDLNEDSKLSTVRSELGDFMQDQDLFTYYDPRQQKVLMQPKNAESDFPLKSVIGGNNQVTITDPNANKPDLEGDLVQWFTDRNLQVSVKLNTSNDDAKKDNEGKFQPFLLSDVQPIKNAADEFADIYFKSAVICEKNSAIAFDMSCWGAAGWGYSIESERVKIVPEDSPLYNTNDGKYGSTKFSWLSRFKKSKNNIVVDSLGNQSISQQDKMQYSKVTITAWNLEKYKRGSTTYESDLQPPFRRGEGAKGMKIQHGVVVPGDGVESGSPEPSGKSHVEFGSINVKKEDKNMILGRVTLYFLVFVDKDAADQMVQQNNLVIPY